MFDFIKPKERLQRDKHELYALELRYGDNTAEILQARVNDETLSKRDRNHWRRLLQLLHKS